MKTKTIKMIEDQVKNILATICEISDTRMDKIIASPKDEQRLFFQRLHRLRELVRNIEESYLNNIREFLRKECENPDKTAFFATRYCHNPRYTPSYCGSYQYPVSNLDTVVTRAKFSDRKFSSLIYRGK